MDIAFKASLFIGVILLLGAGIFKRWIAPAPLDESSRRRIIFGTLAGLVLLLAGSLGEVASITVRIARGRFDGTIFLDYLLSTRHGVSTLLRCGLAVLLTWWGGRTLIAQRLDRVLYSLAGLTVLGTVSWTSHSGVMGLWSFLGDLMHLIAATLWAGAVIYLAWSALWRGPLDDLRRAARRISTVGLVSVLLLAATGTYLGVLHLYSLRALTTTSYGSSLLVKLSFIAIVLAIAGLNRWQLVPRLEQHGASTPLKRAVRAESVLLVAVLLATSVLSTREPPHEHAPHHEAHAPVQSVPAILPGTLEVVGERRYRLTLEPSHGLTQLTARAPDGTIFPVDAPDPRDLQFTLPTQQTGIWRLEGVLHDEPFSLPVTLMSTATATGQRVHIHLTPTPTLAGGGITNLAIATNVEPAEPLVVSYRMPGMQHVTDDQPIILTQTADSLWHAALRFPMVGTWQLTLHAGAETLELPIEVLNE